MQHLEHTYTKKLFVIYLKFKFNLVSCILSGILYRRVKQLAQDHTARKIQTPIVWLWSLCSEPSPMGFSLEQLTWNQKLI